MNHRRLLTLVLGLLPCLIIKASPTVIDNGHLDITVNYIDGAWTTGVHHASGNFAFNDAILHARDEAWPAGSLRNRPFGSQWDFIGVDAGEPFYSFPQELAAGILWPGFASQQTPAGTFHAYEEEDERTSGIDAWITIQLLDIHYHGSGNGHFSLWSTGSFGELTVYMASAIDGITATDRYFITSGGHAHMNWGFSDIGFYELTFASSGYLNDDSQTLTTSDPWTVQFGIGTTTIPEPSTYAFVLLGLIAVTTLARRLRQSRG